MKEGDGRAGKVRNMPRYLGEETSIWVHLELLVDGKEVMLSTYRIVK